MGNLKKVAVVIVTFNRKKLLTDSIRALSRQTYPIEDLYIIDNHSTDGTQELLVKQGIIGPIEEQSGRAGANGTVEQLTTKKQIHVSYVYMEQNTGGAGGFHEGFKNVIEKDYDWVWVMDDDICPLDDCLEALLNSEKADDRRTGVLMPLRMMEDGSMIGVERLSLNYQNPLKMFGGERVKDKYSEETLPSSLKIATIPFEGPLIRMDIMKQVGLPKSEFFIIGDDTDYAIRVGKVADILLIPQAKMIRAFGADSSEWDWKTFYYLRNVMVLDRLHGNMAVKYLRPLIYVMKLLIKEVILERNSRKAKVLSLVVKDLLRGRMGKTIQPGQKF
jgi:rhamnopyranosyl-N-acetylglucosaminyl-diphospho-decaprenol beta-1,3/1,4-galactofuranosyltransferase